MRRGGGTILEITTEILIFLLRVILLAVLYLFLLAVVFAIRHDAGRAAAAAAPVRSARLLVESAGRTDLEEGDALPLAAITSLGRSDHNDVVLRDTFVSGEHAVIRFAEGGWWLVDRGSTNGTMVNEQLVEEAVELGDGDVVSIGQIRLRVAL